MRRLIELSVRIRGLRDLKVRMRKFSEFSARMRGLRDLRARIK